MSGLVELAKRARYDTDKSPEYLAAYEDVFAPIRDRDVRLLELGVYHGGSLQLWRDYFPRGSVAGLDLDPPALTPDDSIQLFKGSQGDVELLAAIRSEVAPDGFDIVIDDCSHFGHLTARSFRCLFNEHLKPSGIYAIEDWGTGYWPSWPDGAAYRPPRRAEARKAIAGSHAWLPALRGRSRQSTLIPSHQSGMVGFVKQLIDEVGRPDIERQSADGPHGAPSTIDRVIVRTGLVIVVKTSGDAGRGRA